jgi:hypothetical protein
MSRSYAVVVVHSSRPSISFSPCSVAASITEVISFCSSPFPATLAATAGPKLQGFRPDVLVSQPFHNRSRGKFPSII